MATSELRRLLEDEVAALEDPMRRLEAEARDFWLHPESPFLRVWGQPPVAPPAPEPPSGTLSERELYDQLMNRIKPALACRRLGFDTVPVVYPHDKHYTGPPFRTHFLAVVMGAEVRYPDDVPVSERQGYRAWVDPILHDLSELDALEEVDVAKSPALRAVLQSYEEMGEIVRGRIALTHYSPTLPLDFAAEIIGHLQFYELVAADPEGALRLLQVCTQKWLEMMRLQETAAGGRWANHMYEPGISVGDMILPFLSPANVRQVVLPYNALLSQAYGGIVAGLGHPDTGLLADYLELPGLCACSLHEDTPGAAALDARAGRFVLKLGFDWHFHRGRKKAAPVCLTWERCCELMSQYAGRLRVQASITGWGDTPEEQRACILGDLDDLRRIWDGDSVAVR